MRLDTKPGEFVEYLDFHGYPNDVPNCRKAGLEKGKRYEVAALSVGQSHSYVWLEGFDAPFNSVCFANSGSEKA